MGRRLALLIATYEYQDATLRQLTSPARDTEALAGALRDPRIAGFEATVLINEPHHQVGAAIGEFYRDRRRDDLTLLYMEGKAAQVVRSRECHGAAPAAVSSTSAPVQACRGARAGSHGGRTICPISQNPSVADSFAGTRNIMTWLPRRRFLLMVKSRNVPLRRLRVPFTHSGLDGASTDRPLVRKAEAFVD
jgi:hypothetical protein